MGYRKFVDRDGRPWHVQDATDSVWTFVPQPGNSADRTTVPAPGYDKDPFELSNEELQKLLDAGDGNTGRSSRASSPFLDSS